MTDIEQIAQRARELLGQGDTNFPYRFSALPKPTRVAITGSMDNARQQQAANESGTTFSQAPTSYNEDPRVAIGTWKDNTGRLMIAPHEGSASMIYAFKADLDLLMTAPELLAGFLEWFDSTKSTEKSQKGVQQDTIV